MAHAIRIYSNPSQTPDDIQTKAESVRDSFTAVLERQEQHVSEYSEDYSHPAHVRCLYRFDDADDKAAIIKQFSEDAFAGVEWYLLQSHICTHDSDEGGPCDGWVNERERGNVPDSFL